MKSTVSKVTILVLTGFFFACAEQRPAPVVSQPVAVKPQVRIVERKTYSLPAFKLPGEWTVDDIVNNYGDHVKDKLKYYFTQAKITYPPREMVLVALKQEKKLELWARDKGEFRLIRDYFILAASGVAGPKLRQGDRQVPEGIYRITELNPNSHYYLSMRLNYPNEFDLFHAIQERRFQPGSDIFIHGKSASIGCLAMGDSAIQELFVLAAKVGVNNVKVVIAPHDPRAYPLMSYQDGLPTWTSELYSNITREIIALSANTQSVKTRY